MQVTAIKFAIKAGIKQKPDRLSCCKSVAVSLEIMEIIYVVDVFSPIFSLIYTLKHSIDIIYIFPY